MKNLVLAAVAATMAMPAVASATSILDNRTNQVMNCIESGKTGNALENCVEDVIQWTLNNGAHEANKEVAAFVKAETGVNTINGGYEVDAVKQQIRIALDQESFEAQQISNEASDADETLATIQNVIGKYNSNDANRFANDPDGLVNDVYAYLVDRLADLKRAEGRIRKLEEQIQWHKDGGYWNPTHW